MNIQVIGITDIGGRSLALSFSALNYSLRVLNDVNKKHRNNKHNHTSSSSSPPLPPTSVHLSSHRIKTDEMKNNSSESQKIQSSLTSACPAVNQENTVGIIGGVSVLSTLIFLEKLIWWSSRNGGESVPFIVCSDRIKDFVFSRVDETRVVENLRRQRIFLEEGGARCIVMPCNLSHAWYDEISQGCKLSFLHAADCVVRELKEARLKPLEAGCGVKIGVIATHGSLVARVYQEKLQNQGFEVVSPDKATMEHIVNPAIKSLNRKDKEGAQNLLRIAIQLLLVRAANAVILASDEMQGLLSHDDPLSKKCIDPMDSLARSAVRWAKSIKVHDKNRDDT